MGSNLTHGANFATLSSTIRPPNTTLRQSGISPISLTVQHNEFYIFPSRSQIVRVKVRNTTYTRIVFSSAANCTLLKSECGELISLILQQYNMIFNVSSINFNVGVGYLNN
ncbi:hypothetical protein ACFX2I_011571 [Malus domestica]